MTTQKKKNSIPEQVISLAQKLCKKNKWEYLRVFGSAVQNYKNAKDIDLVIPSSPETFKKYSKYIADLEIVFKKPVDLIFFDKVSNPTLVMEIITSSDPIYMTKKGLELYTLHVDRQHAKATENFLYFPVKERLKETKKISRKISA